MPRRVMPRRVTPFAMTAQHQQHLDRVLARLTRDLTAKYRAGQEEHGGELWTQSGMLDRMYEELLDAFCYVATALEQRETRGHVR